MNLAIVGSRTFDNYEMLTSKIDEICANNNIEIGKIVSGGARGADRMGERFAKERGIETLIFPAEWNKYGKRAGFIRNETIIDNCDICIAFWDGESRGTKHDIDLCKQKGKVCYVVYFGTDKY